MIDSDDLAKIWTEHAKTKTKRGNNMAETTEIKEATKFKEGDRVKYISDHYKDCDCNPKWGGSQGNIGGTIKSHLGIDIKWDNNTFNGGYTEDDLAFLDDIRNAKEAKATKATETVTFNKVLFDKKVKLSIKNILNGKVSVSDDIKMYNNFFDELNMKFINRGDIIEQIKYALITKEHVLIQGACGTAKSMLARTVINNITGSTSFEIQLSKFMSEEYLFGGINIQKLINEGKIEHNTSEGIVKADLAFIDEFFDASDALLRSLLEILNERTFSRNKEKCKLHTAILTSNYDRKNEITEAILDRLIFKGKVEKLSSQEDRLLMYENYINGDNNSHIKLDNKLTFSLINQLASQVDKIVINKNMLIFYDDVLKEFIKQVNNKHISDRTASKTLKVIKASAVLRNDIKVNECDILSAGIVLTEAGNVQERKYYDAIWEKIIITSSRFKQEMKIFKKMTKLYKIKFISVMKNSNLINLCNNLENLYKKYEKDTAPFESEIIKKNISDFREIMGLKYKETKNTIKTESEKKI